MGHRQQPHKKIIQENQDVNKWDCSVNKEPVGCPVNVVFVLNTDTHLRYIQTGTTAFHQSASSQEKKQKDFS